MRRFYIVGFCLLLAFDSAAQLCFSLAGAGAAPLTPGVAWFYRVLSEPWTYGAVAGYIGAFFTWLTLLRRAPVGAAFAASHLEVVTVLALSVAVLGETLTLRKIVGCAVIVVGILCLARDPPAESQ